MSSQAEHINDLISFVATLETKNFQDRFLSSEKELDEKLYQNLSILEEHGFVHQLSFNDEVLGGTTALKRKLGRNKHGKVRFKLELPRSSNFFYANTINDVIAYQSCAWEPPDILILDTPAYNGIIESEPPSQIKAYHLAIELIKLLTNPKAGNHCDKGNGVLQIYILGPNKKLQMDVQYSSNDLDFEALQKAMEILSNILGETAYIGTKYTILRGTLVDLLMPVPQIDRFGYLLSHINEAVTQFQQNYDLFLSEFKFEDEREKIETAKREYLLSINKVFDDIQNKILAIPASLVLIGGQMNFSSKIEPKTLVSNIAILIGSVIFTWIMFLMTRNQRHTLNAIKNDYSLREKRIKFQLTDSRLYGELETAFSDVNRRYNKQKIRLWIVDGMILFGFLITLYLFSKTTACPYLQLKGNTLCEAVKNFIAGAIK